MREGDRIRVFTVYGDTKDFTVESFRYCLGIFASDQHREASKFTPLCQIYENGPDTEQKYISNFGEYRSNQVQGWMDLPRASEKDTD